MKTPEPMTLRLRPTVSGGRVKLSLSGSLPSAQTPQSRRHLLSLLDAAAGPARLDVVLSVDESESWAWSEPWTEALDEVANTFSVRFAVPRGRHAGR